MEEAPLENVVSVAVQVEAAEAAVVSDSPPVLLEPARPSSCAVLGGCSNHKSSIAAPGQWGGPWLDPVLAVPTAAVRVASGGKTQRHWQVCQSADSLVMPELRRKVHCWSCHLECSQLLLHAVAKEVVCCCT